MGIDMVKALFDEIEKASYRGTIKALQEQSLQEPAPVKEADEEVLYTTDEACKILKCSKPTLHRWKKEGIIPHVRIGSNIRYKKSDLEKLGK